MSSHNIEKPNGGMPLRRVMEELNPNENLLERVLSRENMHNAWKRVKANKGVPGIDHMSIDDFQEFARAHWDRIRESLLAGTYQPKPVKRVEIPKVTGGTRPLGIPTMASYCTSQLNGLGMPRMFVDFGGVFDPLRQLFFLFRSQGYPVRSCGI
jgi:hypothetical protein